MYHKKKIKKKNENIEWKPMLLVQYNVNNTCVT